MVHEVWLLDLALMKVITTCGRRYLIESEEVQDGRWTEAWLKRKGIYLPLCCHCMHRYGHNSMRAF